jgi:hypothetical protein
VKPDSHSRTNPSRGRPLCRFSTTTCDHVNTDQISAQTADAPPGSHNCRHQQTCAQSHSHRTLQQCRATLEQESTAYSQACEDFKSKGNIFRQCSRPTSEQHTCGATPGDSCTSGRTRSLGVTTLANSFGCAVSAAAQSHRDSSTTSDHPDTLALLWLVCTDFGQPTIAGPAKKAFDHRLLHSTSASTWPQDRCGPCDNAQS